MAQPFPQAALSFHRCFKVRFTHFKLILLVVAASILMPTSWSQPMPSSLAAIRMAADNGDAVAQDKLGDAYLKWGDSTNAAVWYRKAAEKGVANSQYHLGKILAGNGYNFAFTKIVSFEAVNEALKWYSLAAKQRFGMAELELAQFYEEGKIVQRDYVQAYKWYALAHDAEGMAIVAKIYQDRLILKMSSNQLMDGQQKVTAFLTLPHTDDAVPHSSLLGKLRLSGISGTLDRPLAIINNRTFSPGEIGKITIENQTVAVHCLHIGKNFAVVDVEGCREITVLRIN